MRIYRHSQTTGYEIASPTGDDFLDQLDRINGKPIAKKWTPLRVERIRASRRQGCKPSDAPFMFATGVMVFRRSAVDALRDILDAHGELLPLEDAEGIELYAYNPRALDALDHALTRGMRDARGRISLPYHHVFFAPVVEGVDIFRLKERVRGAIYVGQRFVDRWKQAKLKGLDFTMAWDSELPPEQQPNYWESKPVKL